MEGAYRMVFEFENVSCSSEQITYIKAIFSEDREKMIGVCRITELEIEYKNDVSDEIKSKVETQIFNYFAGKEYFTENDNWKEDAKNDISIYVGISNVDVE